MPSVDEIRQTIRKALKAAGHSPIAVAKDLGRGRDYIRDFLDRKKNSLDAEIMFALAERYSININDLMVTRPVPQIRKGARPHLYVAEHMDARGFDAKDMADRMDGISAPTVNKWRANPGKLEDWQVAAILHALDMADIAELARPPKPATHVQPPSRIVRKRA